MASNTLKKSVGSVYGVNEFYDRLNTSNMLFNIIVDKKPTQFYKSGTTHSLNNLISISNATHSSVAIIAAIDFEETQQQKFYNFWLYNYFELRKKKKNKDIKKEIWNETVTKQIRERPNSTNGVYLWESPYIYEHVDCKECKKTMCWILLVDGCHPKFIEYAALVSSHVFLFTEKDKELFRETLYRTRYKIITKTPEITVFPENMMQNKESIKTHFFGVMEKTGVRCLRYETGSHLSLSEFRDLLGTALIRISSNSGDSNRQVENIANSSIAVQTSTSMSVHENPTVSENKLDESIVEKNYSETQQRIDIEQRIGIHERQPAIHLYNTIASWVADNLDMNNVDNLLECVLELKPYYAQNICTEIFELQDIVVVYKNELENMYDNFVCFSGDGDDKYFSNIFEAAHKNAVTSLKSRKQKNESYGRDVLDKSCKKLRESYTKKNALIVQKEKKIATEVKDRILQVFFKKIQDYLTRNPIDDELLNTLQILKIHSKEMYERILNFNDRYNSIVRDTLKTLDNALDIEITSISGNLLPESVFPSKIYPDSAYGKYLCEFENNILPNFSALSTDELKIWLEQICKSSCSTVPHKNKIDAFFTMRTHFNYAFELHSKCFQSENFKNLMCIYFSKDDLTTAARGSDNKIYYLPLADTSEQSLVAIASMSSDNKVDFGTNAIRNRKVALHYDSILNFITGSHDITISEFMIYNLFKWIRENALHYREFSETRSCVLLIIPAYLNFENRNFLRETAHKSGFKQVYMVTDTAVAAYNVMFPSSVTPSKDRGSLGLVLIFVINSQGVKIEIYQCGKNTITLNQIEMIAASFRPWQNTHKSSPSISNEDCMQTLRSAYEVVASKVGTIINCKTASYILVTDDPQYDVIFDPFFNEQPNWFRVHNWQSKILSRVVLDLGKEPCSITERILDHAVYIGDDISGNDEFPEFAITNAKPNARGKLEINKRKAKLLKQCNMIKSQIDSGNVKLRPLFKKLALEIIERVEVTAKDNEASEDIVEYEEKEIAELIEEHKFQV